MAAKRPKLTCTLKTFVTTGDGDFIPAGTPVQVIGWADGGKLIEVRCDAYVYADDFSIGAIEDGRCHGCVGRGLFTAVQPANLAFRSVSEEKLEK